MRMSIMETRRTNRDVGVAALATAALAALLPRFALAHGSGVTPRDVWRAWQFDPLVLFGCGLTAWVYLRGVAAIWRRAGRGRGVAVGRVMAFLAAMLTLLLALVSPLDTLSESLLSAHMVQHMILILAAAPLLVLAVPTAPLLLGLPPYTRRTFAGLRRRRAVAAIWRIATRPVVAWTLQGVVFWTWHLPPLYQAALRNDAIHALEHASFLVTAAVFWWVVIQPERRRRDGLGLSVLLVFATALQNGVLGALLTFSGTPWYPDYQPFVSGWHLSPLEDQQLAGLIMWIPGGLVYLTAALALLARWLSDDVPLQSARLEMTPAVGPRGNG
jgi:putative membrane protein